jgi:hypothetical protein
MGDNGISDVQAEGRLIAFNYRGKMRLLYDIVDGTLRYADTGKTVDDPVFADFKENFWDRIRDITDQMDAENDMQTGSSERPGKGRRKDKNKGGLYVGLGDASDLLTTEDDPFGTHHGDISDDAGGDD